MKKAAILTLSFMVVVILGFFADDMIFQFHELALQTFGGKPMPWITQWTFQSIAQRQNGGFLCICLIPWALLLFESARSMTREAALEKHTGFLPSFILFLLVEILLSIWAALACFLPFYDRFGGDKIEGSAATSYLPHIILALLVIVSGFHGIIGVRRKLMPPQV